MAGLAGCIRVSQRGRLQKFFNRAMLAAAVAVRWLRMDAGGISPGKGSSLGDSPGVEFAIAGVLVAAMEGSYIALCFCHWKLILPWAALPMIAFSAILVALIDKALFRGAVLGLYRRTMEPYAALF